MIGLVISANMPASDKAPSRAPKTRLDFVITGCWGDPIEEAVVRVVQQKREARIKYPEAQSIEVAPGRLRIIVEAEDYETYSEVIEVGSQAKAIMRCLVALPSVYGGPHISVTGTVAGEVISEELEPDEPWWVRLVGIFSDFNSMALVDKSGSFSFQAVRPGSYYVMLFSNGKLKVAGKVSLSDSWNRISIQRDSVSARRREE
jgi:hypothetical protein